MKNGMIALLVGTIFGVGLTISGMTQPSKVIGFLNVFGDWDPSLAFVMLGAIGVHLFAYRIKARQTSPLLADEFYLPGKKEADSKLVLGSVIFGIGWGLGGYCPGPAITSLASLRGDVVLFVGSMALGMLVQDWLFNHLTKNRVVSK